MEKLSAINFVWDEMAFNLSLKFHYNQKMVNQKKTPIMPAANMQISSQPESVRVEDEGWRLREREAERRAAAQVLEQRAEEWRVQVFRVSRDGADEAGVQEAQGEDQERTGQRWHQYQCLPPLIIIILFLKKMGQTRPLFCLFSFFSHDKYSTNTINEKA